MPFWSKPRCPVDLPYEAWTYLRLQWLFGQLGATRLLGHLQILPTDARWRELASGDSFNVQQALALVSDALGVETQGVGVEIHSDDELHRALGLYVPGPPPMIWLAESQCNDVACAVATLAHEVAHHLLLGGQHLTGQEFDHEYVTDLVTACPGLSVFSANSTVREQSSNYGQFHWWQIQKQGYLPAHVYGWVLALISYLKNEDGAIVAAHLRLDAQTAYHQGLKYLRKDGIPEFLRDLRSTDTAAISDSELVESLRSKRDISRLLALRMLGDRPEASIRNAAGSPN